MRQSALWITLLLLPLLTACGNGNDGKKFNPYPSKLTGSSIQTNPVQVGSQAPSQFQGYVSPTIYTDDAGFNAAFLGSRLSPGLQLNSTTRGNLVRLKVNASVPANTRLCMVPFVYDAMAQEVCFPIDGQYDAILSTNLYTSIVVLPETHLDEYKGYVNGITNVAPSRLLFSL